MYIHNHETCAEIHMTASGDHGFECMSHRLSCAHQYTKFSMCFPRDSSVTSVLARLDTVFHKVVAAPYTNQPGIYEISINGSRKLFFLYDTRTSTLSAASDVGCAQERLYHRAPGSFRTRFIV